MRMLMVGVAHPTATSAFSRDSCNGGFTMHHLLRITFACFIVALAAQTALAADSQPLLAKPGKLLFEDDFARSDMKPKWRVGKGFWTVKDGMATVAENPDDHHGAYAYITP